jgi:tRNA dimethylallyltransferase
VDRVAAAQAPLVVITGPTGGGKSAAALALAEALGGEIVSCDSLQVYRGFDIGSAKATFDERARVPHHLVDVVDADQEFSAAAWVRLAERAIAESFQRGRCPIVVGGTGLYLKALLYGLFEGPSRNGALRDRLAVVADRRGEPYLHAILRRVDPSAAARIAPQDRIRVVRALEVRFLTGRPITEQHKQQPTKPSRSRPTLVLGLDPGREPLREAIERRCDSMLQQGLIEEVRQLLLRWGPRVRPLRAIGYRQIVALLQNEVDLPEARRQIVVGTVQLAKRQRTWLRGQTPPDQWFADGASLVSRALHLLDRGEA